MDYDYALAFALANNALCLFTGAGVAKHLTANGMPDWKTLLEDACSSLDASVQVRVQLDQARADFPLEDCAQIIELAFLRERKDFRKALANLLSHRVPDATSSVAMKAFLESHSGIDVITTNYDLLIESLLPGKCISNFPGTPVARRDNCVDVFHIHGCILNPAGMLVTTNDYYRFINDGGYFSQKVSTMLHENSTVILGYSLSDPNLKAILNRYRTTRGRAINRGNLFYVTQGLIPAHIRDYYESAYGITVVENTEIDALLNKIESKFFEAKDRVEKAHEYLRQVLFSGHEWTEPYIKLRDSLFHIIATANTHGFDIHSPQFAKMLAEVLSKKIKLTSANGAWEQYSHLAEWNIYLGAIMDIGGTPLESTFLNAVEYSMRTMSKDYTVGHSWAAFGTWKSKWESMTFQNRLLVRQHVQDHICTPDALEVVLQHDGV